MIPKIIHYCWFGGKPLPKSAIKCIESWKKYFPDYEIKQWNESNFDVYQTRYTAQAYQAGKYAFVSDYARYKILYEEGGVYFDTDVEVIKSFKDILERGAFMGCESHVENIEPGKVIDLFVNPGLGMGAPQGLSFYMEMIHYYEHSEFFNPDGTQRSGTVVIYTTEHLIPKGLKITEEIQYIDGIYIYPWYYFCPMDDKTGRITITPETYSIHYYNKSWANMTPTRILIARLSHRLLGTKLPGKIKSFFQK